MGWFVLLDIDWIELFSDGCSMLLLIGFGLTFLAFIFAKKHEVKTKEPRIKTEEDAWKQLGNRYKLLNDWILYPANGTVSEELDEEALDFLLKHKHICYSLESLE